MYSDITLFDGRRFVAEARFLAMMREQRLSEQQMAQRRLYPIHRAFRILSTVIPPSFVASGGPSVSLSSGGTAWLTSEFIQLFHFHQCHLSQQCSSVANLLSTVVPGSSATINNKLQALSLSWKSLQQDPVMQLKQTLSLRQMMRVARHCIAWPLDAFYVIEQVAMIRFTPATVRELLTKIVYKAGFSQGKGSQRSVTISQSKSLLRIGSATIEVKPALLPELVPKALFFDIGKHTLVLEALLKSFALGEHILLIGTQGVGKNKLADRLLELMQREREYIQLHRDTTVQTLTLSPVI